MFLFRVRHDIKLQNSDLIYYNVNLMTDVFEITVTYRRKIIAKYRQILPSGNRSLEQKELVIKGLENAGIMETVKSTHDTYTRYENPFEDRCRK